jgi:hypothetical protein
MDQELECRLANKSTFSALQAPNANFQLVCLIFLMVSLILSPLDRHELDNLEKKEVRGEFDSFASNQNPNY